jgi:catechol 2,3-dioxygenase-like lactoylglutathione lyase family enzyme
MDNVLIVVDDLEAAKAFFVELGMELEGEMPLEGPLVDRLVGLENVRCEIAMMRTPDGHGRIELDKFHTPAAVRSELKNAPVNTLGIHRIMFAVDDIDDVLARLRAHGAELIGEVAQYEDTYRLCYIRGPAAPVTHFRMGAGRAGLAWCERDSGWEPTNTTKPPNAYAPAAFGYSQQIT